MENKNVVVSHGNFAPPVMEFFCSLNIFKKKKKKLIRHKKKNQKELRGSLFSFRFEVIPHKSDNRELSYFYATETLLYVRIA